jgi:hypothetical protein
VHHLFLIASRELQVWFCMHLFITNCSRVCTTVACLIRSILFYLTTSKICSCVATEICNLLHDILVIMSYSSYFYL